MIVLDANGDRSKGIARSLRKLGVQASVKYTRTFGSVYTTYYLWCCNS